MALGFKTISEKIVDFFKLNAKESALCQNSGVMAKAVQGGAPVRKQE